MPTVAEITVEAIGVLNLPPGYTEADIRRATADLADTDKEQLAGLDDRFYEYPDPIEERLFAYIVEHRQEIVL
jgi:hypothetical protein